MSLMRSSVPLFRLIPGILRLSCLRTAMAVLILIAGSAHPTFAAERELPVRNVVKPAPGLNPADEVGPIVLSNMPAAQVFGLLQTYSGRVVLQSAGIPNVQLNFNSQGKMRRDEAIFALENLLLLNGVALMEVDERFIRAIPANQSSRGAPNLINALPEESAKAEQVYSKVFPLKYIDPNVAVRYIGPLVSPGGMGTVINLNMSDSILIIDRLSNLEFFEKLLETLDRPVETRQEIYYFPANNTNVWQLRNTLMQIKGSTHRLQLQRTLFWADSRTNMLVVSTEPENYEMIKKMVEELDKEVAPLTTSRVFPIKNTNVWTVYRILQGIVNNQQRIFDRMGFYSGERYGRQMKEEEVPFLITTEGAAAPVEGEGAAAQTPPAGGGQRVETATVSLEQIMEQPIMGEGMPELQFSPYLSLYADPQNSSIVVYGTQADMKRVEYLISELDQRSAPMTESEVFYLEHAEANTLASLVGRIIQMQRSAFQREGLRSGRERQLDDEVIPDIFEEGFQFSPFASVVADRRSNALLVYGTKEDIQQVRDLIKKTDIPVAPITHTKVFPLRHTEVMNIARIVTNIINGQQARLRQVQSQSQYVRVRNDAGEVNLNSDFAEGAYDLQFSPFAMVIADNRSNSLVAYGTSGDMRHLDELLKQLDIEVAPVTQSRVFYLEQANANALAAILNRIVQGQQRAMRNVLSLQRQIRNASEEEEGMDSFLLDGNQTLQFSPYVNIVANQRNNSIIVYGTQSDVDQLAQLIRMNDIKIAPKTSSKIFYIKHAQANAVVRVINPLIQAQLRVRERESTLRRVFLRNNGQEPDSEIGPLEFPVPGEGAESVNYTEQVTDQLLDPSMDFDEDAQFSPYVSLAADERSNSVIAYGTPFDLEQIEALIDKIDRVLPQVRIEVVIAEVALIGGATSGLSEFGINYRSPFDPQNPGIGDIGMIAEGDKLPGTQTPVFEGGMSLGRFSLQTVFRVARQKSNVKILSAPTITTTHNRLAKINIGEARPIITSTVSNVTSGSSLATRSEVEYRDIGIELRVRPMISDGNVIQMELEQVVETVVDTQTIDNNIQPIIGTRRATSFLSIRDQEVLVMGGLQSVESTDRAGRVWLLGDLPILGSLFQPTSREQTVRELIIFIRPSIVQSSDEASMLSSKALENTAVGDEVKYYLNEGSFREQELVRPPQATPIPMDKTLLPVVVETEDPESVSEPEVKEQISVSVETEAVTESAPTTEETADTSTDTEEEETASARRASAPFRTRR